MLSKNLEKQPLRLPKILVFGAGDFGERYLTDAINRGDREIVGVLDNDSRLHDRMLYGRFRCYPPEKVKELEYDRIIIANNSGEKMRAEIFEQLLGLGVLAEQVEYHPTVLIQNDYRIPFFRGLPLYFREQRIGGNIAECGVHTGETAKFINRYFYDRRLYLFDTFEGFTRQDVEAERAIGDPAFCESGFNQVGGFDTSVELVLSKMTFPENVIIKKGWVPESFEGVEDTFCFVHLDMDLYQPMLAALNFFWDKVSRGGVFLLHDYQFPVLPGVKKAVNDFETKLGRSVSKVPLNNSIVLVKD